MSFWSPPPGAVPYNYSFSTPLGKLKKPPVSNNPITKVQANPVKADVQGVMQAKMAAAKLGLIAALYKRAASKDIVDMASNWGRLADLIPSTWGGERAGRTQAMADAIDEDTTFGVRHPLTSDLMYSSLGSGLGALGGAGLGYLASRMSPTGASSASSPALPRLRFPVPSLSGATNVAVGGGLGVVGGGVLGQLLAAMLRRREMKRVGKLYDERAAEGTVTPKDPEFSSLSALLLPARGPHRTGQRDAVMTMRSGDDKLNKQRSRLNDVGYLLAPGWSGYAQNLVTQVAAPEPKGGRRRGKTEKEAADRLR